MGGHLVDHRFMPTDNRPFGRRTGADVVVGPGGPLPRSK